MTFHKLKVYFVIFVFCFHHVYGTRLKNEDNYQNFGVRFKSVKCQSDNKTIFKKFCFLKPLSRKIVTFNAGFKLLVPYTKPVFGHTIIYYRYGTIFRQIIDTKKLEICAILNNEDTNPFVRLMIDMLKSRAPNLIHKCPFNGNWDLTNFTVDMDLMDKVSMIFPEGTYRLDISFFLLDQLTVNFTGMADVKSPFKESFG